MKSTEFAELLKSGESNWLDWKRQLDPILEQQTSSHSDWNKGKGTLLKDIAALANAISSREKRYLIRGVQDHGHARTIIGITKRFDDSTFQTWVNQTFDPPIHIHYEEIEAEPNKIVGIFEITYDPKGPHVSLQDLGPLHKGQIWLRRGTSNDFAKRADLDALLKHDAIVLPNFGAGEAIAKLQEYYSPREVIFPSFGNQYIMCTQGYELAFWPGTRQQVHIQPAHLQRPELIAMLKPVQGN
jgi:predicted HTH transcriptional regulator